MAPPITSPSRASSYSPVSASAPLPSQPQEVREGGVAPSPEKASDQKEKRPASPFPQHSPTRQQQLLEQVGHISKKARIEPALGTLSREVLEAELGERLCLNSETMRHSEAELVNGEFRLSLRPPGINLSWDSTLALGPEQATSIKGMEGETLYAKFQAYKQKLQEAQKPAPVTDAFAPEIHKQIIEDVKSAFFAWDEKKLAGFQESILSLLPDGRFLGLLMDAIYKRHFNGKFDLDKMVSDEALKTIYADSLNAMIAGQEALVEQEKAKPGQNNLNEVSHNLAVLKEYSKLPARFPANETLRLLQDEFNKMPRLKHLSLGERAALVVEPYHLEMLEKQGVDRNNPLLALMYDYREDFSLKTCKGWIKSEQIAAEKKTCDLEDIEAVHEVNSGSGYGLPETESFGAYCSKEGLLRIGENMKFLATELGIQTKLRLTSADGTEKAYGQVADGVHVLDPHTLEPITNSPIPGFVKDLLAQEAEAIDGKAKFYFRSGPADEPTTKNALRRISKDYAKSVGPILEEEQKLRLSKMPPATILDHLITLKKERVGAAATTYLLAQMLHPMRDGNYRLFGMHVLNMLLAQQGEQKIARLRYSAFSDGSSEEEVTEELLHQLGDK